MTTLAELDRLQREVQLALISKQLREIEVMGMTRRQWLASLGSKVWPEFFKPAQRAGVYRAAPQKVQPLRQLPYEIKNLQPGEPGYEAEQALLNRLWLAERRRNGYHDL